MRAVAQAVAEGTIGGRLWLYANYHCNLTCTYCLTESAPAVARRQLPLDQLPEIAAEARAEGFTALGVTGGEPFLVPGALGIRVRVATTTEGLEPDALARLCELHRSLGVPDEDHVVRPVVRRGRAVDHGLGVDAGLADLPAELTITADGAFWSPFGPTVHGGRLDTDLLITRTTRPLSIPARAMLRIAGDAGPRSGPEGPRIC